MLSSAPLIPAAGTYFVSSTVFAVRASGGVAPCDEVERGLLGKATGYPRGNPGKAGAAGVSLTPSTSCSFHFFPLVIKTCIENSRTSANTFHALRDHISYYFFVQV